MKLNKIISIFIMLPLSGAALAHGYVEQPMSRSFACKNTLNQNCGAIQYEPQSVEYVDPNNKTFPEGAPADGHIASGGIERFHELDEQSADRWYKTPVQAGAYTFHWHHTALHKTTSWSYFITKPDWNPDKPLSRDEFESQPFCQVNNSGALPATDVYHSCTLPPRMGYQIILAVWKIADTHATFMQVIDVDFSNNADFR